MRFRVLFFSGFLWNEMGCEDEWINLSYNLTLKVTLSCTLFFSLEMLSWRQLWKTMKIMVFAGIAETIGCKKGRKREIYKKKIFGLFTLLLRRYYGDMQSHWVWSVSILLYENCQKSNENVTKLKILPIDL